MQRFNQFLFIAGSFLPFPNEPAEKKTAIKNATYLPGMPLYREYETYYFDCGQISFPENDYQQLLSAPTDEVPPSTIGTVPVKSNLQNQKVRNLSIKTILLKVC